METYNLQIVGGHLLFDDGNGLVLIDTGSPMSFHQDGIIKIMGEAHNVSGNFLGVGPDYLSKKVGANIKGLVGMDILSNIPMLIDIPNEKIIFGEEHNVHNISAGNLMGVPSVAVEVERKSAMLLLDTGAFISYIDPSFVAGKESIRTEHDFSPMMLCAGNNEFDTPIYQLSTKVSGEEMNLEYGTLPPMINMAISMTGAKGIIGYSLLSHKAIYIYGDTIGFVR